MKKGNTKKLIRNFIVFVGLIFLTLWVILKDQSITDIIMRAANIIRAQYIRSVICILDSARKEISAAAGSPSTATSIMPA